MNRERERGKKEEERRRQQNDEQEEVIASYVLISLSIYLNKPNFSLSLTHTQNTRIFFTYICERVYVILWDVFCFVFSSSSSSFLDERERERSKKNVFVLFLLLLLLFIIFSILQTIRNVDSKNNNKNSTD